MTSEMDQLYVRGDALPFAVLASPYSQDSLFPFQRTNLQTALGWKSQFL